MTKKRTQFGISNMNENNQKCHKRNMSELIDEQFKIPQPDKIFGIKDLQKLFNAYSEGEIDENAFENEFYIHYTRDSKDVSVTDKEREILNDLSEKIHRFSPYIEDHKMAPAAFLTIEEARQKILTAKQSLDILMAQSLKKD